MRYNALSMAIVAHDLWDLTWNYPYLDPDDLAAAIQHQVGLSDELDFRTRLLIRDSIRALEQHWGSEKTRSWLYASPHRDVLDNILQSDLGEPGFPSLNTRVMQSVKPEKVLEYLRTLGARTAHPTRVTIGGSIALILAGQLSRPTEDIDVVDEVPAELRSQHDLLNSLSDVSNLQLTHFQSHYLPTGWENRVRSLGVFGQLQVALVDTYDIFLGKLFSARDKDLKDLRVLKPQLDQPRVETRLLDTAAALLAEPALKKNAQDNWYILFGQPLPERSPA
jgi:hypothetical protein